jgi:hypothetical protein
LRRQQQYAIARDKSRGRSIEIDYTVVRGEAGIGSLGRFLGVDPSGFGQQRTTKRNSDDIVSRFDNPEVVRAYLADNGFEHWAWEN